MRGVGGSELAFTASPPPPPPHLSSFGSQLNPSFILTSRVKVLVYACPIMSNKNRSRIKITCFKGLEKWEATS